MLGERIVHSLSFLVLFAGGLCILGIIGPMYSAFAGSGGIFFWALMMIGTGGLSLVSLFYAVVALVKFEWIE